MHKHLMKKSVTAALVAGGLVGLGAQPAQADGLLFPYLSTQAGVFSFVSVVSDGSAGTTSGAEYQFTYGHKTASAASPLVNTANCSHFNASVHATENDMLTFHVGGTITTAGAAGFALFEPNGDGLGFAAGQLTSTPQPLGVADQLAFLIVEHNVDPNTSTVNLFGWAEVIDTGANLSFAYSTHNFVDQGATVGTSDFTAQPVSSGPVVLSWYPASLVDSRWHILNLGETSSMAPAGGTSAIRSVYTVENAAGIGGAYNRDEQFFSGAKLLRIRCFGIATRGDLLNSPVLAATNDGGWTRLNRGGTQSVALVTDAGDPLGTYSPSTSSNPLVHKIQTVTSATGLAPRQMIDREPSVDPSYAP